MTKLIILEGTSVVNPQHKTNVVNRDTVNNLPSVSLGGWGNAVEGISTAPSLSREQVEKEGAARRRFTQTLADLTKPELNKFYNQNFINEQIHKSTDMKGYYPYKYTGQGDSYFVSKDMYNSLVATCRCGRPKSEGHVIKCLQKVKNKYLEKLECTPAGRSGTYDNIGDYGSSDYSKKNGNASSSWKPFFIGKVPETSGGMVGWLPNRFAQWERSTRYISPVLTMPGHRIAERPYNHIFIG